MTNNFINECKNKAFMNRLSTITKVDGTNNKTFKENTSISSLIIENNIFSNGSIIGSTNIKDIELNLINPNYILSKEDKINVNIGVKYSDTSTEYINLDNYIVDTNKPVQGSKTSKIQAYNILRRLDDKYICNLDFSTGNKTVGDFFSDICNQLGVIPYSTTFLNSTFSVSGNPFDENIKIRDVLSDIEEISCTFSEIISGNDFTDGKLKLSWLSSDIDYTFETNDYTEIEGETICGPYNCLTIKDSQVDGENVSLKDDTSILANGENEICIIDNAFLYDSDKRNSVITSIFNKINGLTYVDTKLTTYTGKPFLKCGNKIKIKKVDGTEFITYILKHTFTFNGTFQSVIESPSINEQQTIMKNNNVAEVLRNTQHKVDKINGQISSITFQQNSILDSLNNVYTKENVNELIQTAENGLTNTFKTSGGLNIWRNTSFFEKTNDNYNFWNGTAVVENDIEALSKKRIYLQNSNLFQEQIITNGKYTNSFYYEKLISTANVSVKINGKTIELTESGEIITVVDVKNSHISIEFICDTDNACFFRDLMLCRGEMQTSWQQNANESESTNINIGEHITIKNSNVNTYQTMGADGNLIRNAITNEIKTKFTDKGIESDEIVCKKATIASLLIENTNNRHTSITGL